MDSDESNLIDYMEMLKSYDITSKERTTSDLLKEYDEKYNHYKEVETVQPISTSSNTIERKNVRKEANRQKSPKETRDTETRCTEEQTPAEVATTSKVVSKTSQTNKTENLKSEKRINQFTDGENTDKMDWDSKKQKGKNRSIKIISATR